MAVELHRWDVAEHLQTHEAMALYAEACLDEAGDDAAFVAKAVGDIARPRGVTQLLNQKVQCADAYCTLQNIGGRSAPH